MKAWPVVLVLGGAGAAAALYFSQRVQRSGNVRLNPVGIKYDKSDSNILSLAFDVAFNILNPENVPVNVKAVFLDVFIEGKRIGNINHLERVEIPARKEINVDVGFSVSTLSLGLTIFNLIKGGTLPKKALIKGFIDSDFGRVNIENEIPFLK